jgi:choline dehydrogenase-like flavoprotein
MIRDANSIPNGSRLEADVCVVGGGPAGIALALTLSDQGHAVLLLESGQLQADAATQDLYEGDVADEQLHSPPGQIPAAAAGRLLGHLGRALHAFRPGRL